MADVLDVVSQAAQGGYQAPLLQFPFGHPCVTSVIPGGFEPAHVKANLGHMRHRIPSDLWAELRHEGLIREDAPAPKG